MFCMWIYIVAGIVILLLIAIFAVAGILFFGALRRDALQKKEKITDQYDLAFSRYGSLSRSYRCRA